MDLNKRLKKLKLIVSDLDGTLLNENSEISDEIKDIIYQIRKSGVYFSFASGRLHSALKAYADELSISIPLISLDGTLIKSNNGNKESIYQSVLPEKKVKHIINLANRYMLNYALCHGEAVYYDENNSVVPQILDKMGAEMREVKNLNNFLSSVLEIVILGNYKEAIRYINEKLHFPYAFSYTTNFYKSQRYEDIYYLEVRRKGSSKGNGLKKLAKYLNVNTKECAVIGDWYNDISLFETNALKVAVNNAVPEIKRKADLVLSKSNEENAVADFLRMILKAKGEN